MKTKWPCALIILILLSTVFVAEPFRADAAALEWEQVDSPGMADNIVVSPSEVSDIAIGQNGILYAIDSENSQVYRSLDAGMSWEEISSALSKAGADLPASKITVAPDNEGIVATVTDSGSAVYISLDGGMSWEDSNVPTFAANIQAIAISARYTEDGKPYREIAVGTAEWGDGSTTGQLWVLQGGSMWASWENQNLAIDPLHIGAEISALAYSPDYQHDRTLIVVASTAGDVAASYQERTWLCPGERDTDDDSTSWDSFDDYPLEIATAGDGVGIAPINSSLALPSDYSSKDESSRRLFVSYDREPDAGDDIYLIDEDTTHRLDANGGAAIDIASISYHGTINSGTLLAGDADPVGATSTVQVRRTEEPFDQHPKWYTASVPPTGPGNALVSWNPDGTIAYCGTSQSPGDALDESAVSASLDGDNWCQLGLIDTVIELADIAPAPDAESLLITTCSLSGPEGIWRSTGDKIGRYWERVLTMDTDTNAVIVRLSSSYSDDSTIYAVEAGGNLMAVSYNRGNTWQWCRAPGPVIDMVVSDEETVYIALPDGYISKTTDSGWDWQDPVDTGLSEINMLAIAEKETLLVGGRDGEVAYSSDGGDNFTQIPEAIDGGDIQVIADVNFEENDIIYAASNTPDSGLWRWTIGASARWRQLDEAITAQENGQSIAGLATGSEGTLYALGSEPASDSSGGVTRSLNPFTPVLHEVEFDWVNYGLPAGAAFEPTTVLPNSLPYLKASQNAEQNELWSIDTANQAIYRFQDTMCKFGPSLDTPEDEAIIPTDSCSHCYVTNLFLHWTELSEAMAYQATISLDSDACQILWSGSTDDISIMATDSATMPKLTSGITCYWRVRAIEPMKSPWSDIWSFTPALMSSSVGQASPAPGATSISVNPVFTWDSVAKATSYEFILSKDSEFTDVIIALTENNALPTTAWGCDRELDYSTTYFWKVRAINANIYGDWATNVFTTEADDSTLPTLQSPPSSSPSPGQPSLISSHLLWAMVGIVVALAAALLVLLIRARA